MATFEQLVHILRRLSQVRDADGGASVGSLQVDGQDTLDHLNACLAVPEDTGLSSETVTAMPAIGDVLELRLDTPRPAFGLVRHDLAALLRFRLAYVREPQKYFLWQERFSKDDAITPGSAVDRYRQVLSLIQVLKASAAFLDEEDQMLVFIRSGKFEVPVKYGADDLAALDLDELQKLALAIPQGTHRAQCQSILSEAVHEVLAPLAPADRFAHLLRNLKDVHQRYERGYQLFAAGFSYEKIRDQVETARIEFTGKLHKVFSDIQNQLLGIPVATVIVATQMKEHAGVTTEFWVSLAVLLGSFVFAGLVHLLLRNQRHTLEVVGLEIERQRKELEKQPQGIVTNLIPTFELLGRRYRTQLRILQAIDWVVLGGVALSLFFFYHLSGPTKRWIDGLLA